MSFLFWVWVISIVGLLSIATTIAWKEMQTCPTTVADLLGFIVVFVISLVPYVNTLILTVLFCLVVLPKVFSWIDRTKIWNKVLWGPLQKD